MVGDRFGKNGYGSLMFQRAMAIVLLAVSGLTACGGSDSSDPLPFVVDVMCLKTELLDGNGDAHKRQWGASTEEFEGQIIEIPAGTGEAITYEIRMFVWSDGRMTVASIPDEIVVYDDPDTTDPASIFMIDDRALLNCDETAG